MPIFLPICTNPIFSKSKVNLIKYLGGCNLKYLLHCSKTFYLNWEIWSGLQQTLRWQWLSACERWNLTTGTMQKCSILTPVGERCKQNCTASSFELLTTDQNLSKFYTQKMSLMEWRAINVLFKKNGNRWRYKSRGWDSLGLWAKEADQSWDQGRGDRLRLGEALWG